MGLDALLARLEGRAVTPVTPAKTPAVTGKAAQLVSCTAVTAQSDAKANKATREPCDREAWEERAAIAEFDGGLSREEAEALARKEDNRRCCNQTANAGRT